MYKRIIFIAFVFFSCKKDNLDQGNYDYSIDVVISNIEDGRKIFLRKQEDNLTIDLDSTTINVERALFQGSLRFPEVYGVFIEGYKQGIFPIVEKGTITINANVNELYTAQISGTKLNDQLATFKRRSQEISSKMNDLFHEFQKARAENNSEKLVEINQQMQKINNEKIEHSISFVKGHPDSFVASMVLHTLLLNEDVSNEIIAELYSQLSDDVKKSEFSKNIALELKIDTIRNDPLNQSQ